MSWLVATTVFIILGLLVIAGYDYFVAFQNDVPNELDTISGRFRAWGKTTLILSYVWAILYGHFWTPLQDNLMPLKTSVPLMLFSGWAIMIGGLALRSFGVAITTSWILFFVVLNVGALAGALLWPQ
jgi:hypothetical protein